MQSIVIISRTFGQIRTVFFDGQSCHDTPPARTIKLYSSSMNNCTRGELSEYRYSERLRTRYKRNAGRKHKTLRTHRCDS